MNYAAVFSVAAILCTQVALAAESTPGAPVEISVTPRTPLTGQAVTISGTTGYHKQSNSVTIAIKPPSGTAPKAVAVPLNEKGEFSYPFGGTQAQGKYVIEVTGPGGQGRGSSEFLVVDLPGLADQLEASFAAIEQRANQLTTTVKKNAAALPASPQREELLKKIAAIEDKARTVSLPPVEVLGQLRKARRGKNVVNLPDQVILPDLPDQVLLPDQLVIGKLQKSMQDMDAAVAEIDRSGLIGARRDTVCETINTAIEGAKFAGIAFNVAATALLTLKSVLVDKSIGSLVSASMGETGEAAAVSAGLKTAVAGLDSGIAALKSIPGLCLDFVEYGVKQVFGAFCHSLRGPMRVRMLMTWNEARTAWLKYGVRLEGRLTLRYEKSAPAGKPLTVTGEFEGSATKFTFWENIFVIERLPRTIVPLQRLWLPLTGVPAAVEWPVDFGSILRSITPYSFNIPVTGVLVGDELQLRIEPARVDFSSAVKNRLLLVVFNGITPDFKTFTFPIEKAGWIVLKGFGDKPKLEIQKDDTGKRWIAVERRHHRETQDRGVVVDWDIRFDTRLKSLKELPAPPFNQ